MAFCVSALEREQIIKVTCFPYRGQHRIDSYIIFYLCMYFSFPLSNSQGAKISLTSLRTPLLPICLVQTKLHLIFLSPLLKNVILLFPDREYSCREGSLSQRERGRKPRPLPEQRKDWRRQPESTIRRVPPALSTSTHFQTLLAMFETAPLNPFSTTALYLFREMHFNRATTLKNSPIVSPKSLIEICVCNWLLSVSQLYLHITNLKVNAPWRVILLQIQLLDKMFLLSSTISWKFFHLER